MIIYAMLQTIELWIFVGILGGALVAEEIVKKMKLRQELYQKRIDAEVDRLHK